MTTCRECKHMTPHPSGDPGKGVCIQERSNLPETQKNPTAIRGKMVKRTDSCKSFEAGESWKDKRNLL